MFRPASTYDIAATADTATTAINPNFDDTDGYDDDIKGDVDDYNDYIADAAAKAEDDDKENVSKICMKALHIVYCHLLVAKLYVLNKKDCTSLNMDQIISP